MPPRTRKPAEVETVETVAADAPKRTKTKIDYSNLPIGNVAAVTEKNPFGRGSQKLPEDNPIVILYRQSFEAEKPIRIATDEPRKIITALRRVANQEDRGVRIKEEENAVVFLATARKKFNRKPTEG